MINPFASELTDEQKTALVDECLSKLREHFPCVQILVCEEDSDGHTNNLYRGAGLWHGRLGMAHEFIGSDQARTTARELGRKITPQSDDGEDWKQ